MIRAKEIQKLGSESQSRAEFSIYVFDTLAKVWFSPEKQNSSIGVTQKLLIFAKTQKGQTVSQYIVIK